MGRLLPSNDGPTAPRGQEYFEALFLVSTLEELARNYDSVESEIRETILWTARSYFINLGAEIRGNTLKLEQMHFQVSQTYASESRTLYLTITANSPSNRLRAKRKTRTLRSFGQIRKLVLSIPPEMDGDAVALIELTKKTLVDIYGLGNRRTK